MAYKGRFRPKNPQKYKGDPTKIIYRSLWEVKVFKRCDEHPDIVEWSSEEIIIPYYSPIDGKWHRYFPDVYIKKKVGDNQYEEVLIEIKPEAQTRPPDISKKNATKTGRVSRRYLNEVKRYGINDAKWEAAKKYCATRGWRFQILTERSLGIK